MWSGIFLWFQICFSLMVNGIFFMCSWLFAFLLWGDFYLDHLPIFNWMFFSLWMWQSLTTRCESWTIKKGECRRIDAFELWCWRRYLRVPWTARRSNQSILKEISPEYHWLNGHEFEQASGVDEGQGSLAYCSPWGLKELDMTEQLNWTLSF